MSTQNSPLTEAAKLVSKAAAQAHIVSKHDENTMLLDCAKTLISIHNSSRTPNYYSSYQGAMPVAHGYNPNA